MRAEPEVYWQVKSLINLRLKASAERLSGFEVLPKHTLKAWKELLQQRKEQQRAKG